MRWHVAAAVLFSPLVLAASVHADAPRGATAPEHDELLERLLRIPGLTVEFEDVAPWAGYRFLLLSYTQPVDHERPRRGTFQQRFSLLHHDFDAPMVTYMTGYDMYGVPFRSEPTAFVDGNQIEVEHRFFAGSTPEPTNWRDLDIYQAAADQHRLIQALKSVYAGPWLSTGASKGGMATVYHRRFFPDDVAGSIAYVAPNDVDNDDDHYDEFLEHVGPNRTCRERVWKSQRRALRMRDEIVPWLEEQALENGCFVEPGLADVLYEMSVAFREWEFWQYDDAEGSCPLVPDKSASDDEVLEWFGAARLATCTLETSEDSGYGDLAYYYQAATELGWADLDYPHIADLLRYGELDDPEVYLPAEIPVHFDPSVMPDIARWLRREGSELLFVYGEYDPWTAEAFQLGKGSRDSFVYVVEGGNHYAEIVQLEDRAALEAANTIRRWAGLPPLEQQRVGPSSAVSPVLEAALASPLDGFEPLLRTRQRAPHAALGAWAGRH